MNTKAKPIDPIAAFDAGVENPSPQLTTYDESQDRDNSDEDVEDVQDEDDTPPAEGEQGAASDPPPDAGTPDPKAAAAKPDPAPVPDKTAKPAVPAKPAKDAAAAPDGKKPDDKAPISKEDHDKAVATEVKQLNLGPKAAARFAAMSDRIRELEGRDSSAPLAKPLEGLVNFKDRPEEVQQQLTRVAQRARDADQMDAMIEKVGAPVEAVQTMFGYLQSIFSKEATPETMEKGYAMLTKELQWLGQKLGKKVEGYDPVAEHADLKDRVARGDLDERDALEIAQARAKGKAHTEHQSRTTAASQQEQDQEAAIGQLRTLGDALRKRDGDADANARLDYIRPLVEEMTRLHPPKLWAEKTLELYTRAAHIKGAAPVSPPPPPRTPLPGRQPLRSSVAAGQGSTQVRQPTNAIDAFDVGVAEERARQGIL